MGEATQRLFVAIDPSERAAHALECFQTRLLRDAKTKPIRWAPPGQFHLTVRFLGDTPSGAVPSVQEALERAVDGISPFQLSYGGLGLFPNERRPLILWCGFTGELAALKNLHVAVTREIAPLGYPPEDRPFTPHITLGRMKELHPVEKQSLGVWFMKNRFEGAEPWTVRSIRLMRSDLNPQGAQHELVAEIPFKTR